MIKPFKPEYDELKDYKFFCFNGKVKFFKVDFGRFVEHHANYYDTDGNMLPFGENSFEPDPSYILDLRITLDICLPWQKYSQRMNLSSVWISTT